MHDASKRVKDFNYGCGICRIPTAGSNDQVTQCPRLQQCLRKDGRWLNIKEAAESTEKEFSPNRMMWPMISTTKLQTDENTGANIRVRNTIGSNREGHRLSARKLDNKASWPPPQHQCIQRSPSSSFPKLKIVSPTAAFHNEKEPSLGREVRERTKERYTPSSKKVLTSLTT